MKKVENDNGLELISVVVPVYNGERHLAACLESILDQSYENIEVIIVDDGSVDDSGNISDAFAGKDHRIRVIHTENKGVSAARNIGIEDSNGDFIFFVDSDDFLEKNALKSLMEKCIENKADLTIGDFVREGTENRNSGLFTSDRFLSKSDVADYARAYLKKPNRPLLFSYCWGRLYRTSLIKMNNIRFEPDLRTFEDIAFNYAYLKYAESIFFVAAAAYHYRMYPNDMSASMTINCEPNNLFGYKSALASIGAFLRSCGADADIDREVGHAYIFLTIIQLIRTCRQMNKYNEKVILDFIRGIVEDEQLRDSLKYYSPSKGESKILPLLMKLRLAGMIRLVCSYKAYKRYGKGKRS